MMIVDNVAYDSARIMTVDLALKVSKDLIEGGVPFFQEAYSNGQVGIHIQPAHRKIIGDSVDRHIKEANA